MSSAEVTRASLETFLKNSLHAVAPKAELLASLATASTVTPYAFMGVVLAACQKLGAKPEDITVLPAVGAAGHAPVYAVNVGAYRVGEVGFHAAADDGFLFSAHIHLPKETTDLFNES